MQLSIAKHFNSTYRREPVYALSFLHHASMCFIRPPTKSVVAFTISNCGSIAAFKSCNFDTSSFFDFSSKTLLILLQLRHQRAPALSLVADFR